MDVANVLTYTARGRQTAVLYPWDKTTRIVSCIVVVGEMDVSEYGGVRPCETVTVNAARSFLCVSAPLNPYWVDVEYNRKACGQMTKAALLVLLCSRCIPFRVALWMLK